MLCYKDDLHTGTFLFKNIQLLNQLKEALEVNFDKSEPLYLTREELNKTVQGNILQTFIYWMRSASLTENKTIRIESESNLDFNFVRSIPTEKLILLRNILIHNGLDVNRLAKISRVDKSQMELQVQQ